MCLSVINYGLTAKGSACNSPIKILQDVEIIKILK